MNSRKKVAVLAASMVLSTSLSAFAMPLEKVGTGFSHESCSKLLESITMILDRLDPKSS